MELALAALPTWFCTKSKLLHAVYLDFYPHPPPRMRQNERWCDHGTSFFTTQIIISTCYVPLRNTTTRVWRSSLILVINSSSQPPIVWRHWMSNIITLQTLVGVHTSQIIGTRSRDGEASWW